jgi:Lar family restriction alleviation protein
MSEDIKPCPFCGSEENLEKDGTFYEIVCSNYECGAEINSFKNKEHTIEVWNHRVKEL